MRKARAIIVALFFGLLPNISFARADFRVGVDARQNRIIQRKNQCVVMNEVNSCIAGNSCFAWWKVLKANKQNPLSMNDFIQIPHVDLAQGTWVLEFHFPEQASFVPDMSIIARPYAVNRMDEVFNPPVCGIWQLKVFPKDPSNFSNGCGPFFCNPLASFGCASDLLLGVTTFEVPCPPDFGSCTALGGGGDVHYDYGIHGIVGVGNLPGRDDVYYIWKGSDRHARQCFCGLDGRGIQSDWWKIDTEPNTDPNRFHFRENRGQDWGLDSGPYLIRNRAYACTPTPH